MRRFPKKKNYWFQLSSVLWEMKDYQEALSAIEMANGLGLLKTSDENLKLVRLYLLTNLPYKAAELLAERIEDGRIDSTEENYELLSTAWLQAKEIDRAAKSLEQAAALSKDSDLYVRLGKLRLAEQNWSLALGAFEQALAKGRLKDPGEVYVLSAYARLCVEHEAPVPAMRALEALTRLFPEIPEYFYLLGLSRLQLAESDGAVAALRRSLELDPDQVLPLFALGLSFRDQKRFTEAEEALTESLRLMPTHADALVVLAEQYLNRALESGGESAEALYVLGKIRHAQGRYEEARDALERSIAKNPRPRKVHYVLSLAYARLGDRVRSREALELYRTKTREAEELLIKMRTDAGLGVSGMRRGG